MRQMPYMVKLRSEKPVIPTIHFPAAGTRFPRLDQPWKSSNNSSIRAIWETIRIFGNASPNRCRQTVSKSHHKKKSVQISVIRKNPRSINYAIASFISMTSLNQSFFLILQPSKSNNQWPFKTTARSHKNSMHKINCTTTETNSSSRKSTEEK